MSKVKKDDVASQLRFELQQIISLLHSLKGIYPIKENDQFFLGRSGDGTLISFDKERLVFSVQFSQESFFKTEQPTNKKISFSEYLDWYDAQSNE